MGTTLQLAKADSRLTDSKKMWDHLRDYRALSYGRIWRAKTAPIEAFWTTVTEGDGRLVAVASAGSGNRVMVSGDCGENWSQVGFTGGITAISLPYGNGVFLAAGNGVSVRSVNYGNTWLAAGIGGHYVIWDGEAFVGSSAGMNPLVLRRSTDLGETFETIEHDLDWVVGARLRYYDGRYLLVGVSVAAVSENAVNWTEITPVTNAIDIAYANGRYVIVTTTSGKPKYSDDEGATWTDAVSPEHAFRGVAHLNGVFIAYTETGVVLMSPDGAAWRQMAFPEANEVRAMTSIAGRLVAVCTGGTNQIFLSDV